ncbi:MAG: SusC/RagA family TonB-linked outer membrane protein [Chitinophagaceae bacterium]|nr:SusC/RagA family TonB-linked outer membrane protein [Chitinophagaceae bacterium]
MRKLLSLVLCLSVMISSAWAQNKTVTGTVTDEKGNPLSGVSISFASNQAKLTGVDGKYSIQVPSTVKSLTFSSVGYGVQVIDVKSQSVINVKLVTDDKLLSEVVVTGVGAATSKKKLGIAVESVNISNQVKVPTGDVGQQLVGQVAGAQIQSSNGNPGRPLNILLRGINTVQGGTSPMILIDGIEARATSLNSIDVNIIDKVEIIQGAAAASLYGAQGANGVIQLFTKKAKAGKFNIDFSTSASTSTLLNVGGLAKAKNHAFVTDGSNNVLTGSNVVMALDPATMVYNGDVQYNSLGLTSYQEKPYNANLRYNDHYAMFFQNTSTYNNSLTISGSRDRFDFLLSGSSNIQNSPFKSNGGVTRSNLTAKLGIELAKGLKLTSLTQLVSTNNTMLDQTGRSIFFAVNNTRPFANFSLKDVDGNYATFYGAASGVNSSNPFYNTQYSSSLIEKLDAIQTLNLNYKMNKFVELDAKYSMNYTNTTTTYRYEDQGDNKNAVLQNRYTYNYVNPTNSTNTGEINNFVGKTTFQNFIGTANFRTDFQKDFNINIPLKTITTGAFDYRNSIFRQFGSYGYDAPGYTPWNATQAAVYKVVSDYVEPFITYGFLANQRFEWSDLAGLAVGVRSDYSSAFGAGAKPQTFPRGDAFLNVSKFKWFETSKVSNLITDFKLRAAYGAAGIQPGAFQRFATLSTASLGPNSYFRFNTTNPNPDLSVEISKETEFGTDIALKLGSGSWLQSANIAFTYWKRNTDNAIYSVDAAPSTGVGGKLDNAFGLTSNGIQASLNLSILNKKDFSWDLTTNFSKQASSISYVKGPPVIIVSAAGSTGITLKEGLKIGQIFGYKMMRSLDEINPQTGKPFIPADQQINYEVVGKGWVVNKATKQAVALPGQYSLGDPNPKFNMSFINNFRFKNFLTFNMQWDWLNGNMVYNQTKQWMYRDGIHSEYDVPVTINGETRAYTAFYRSMYAGGAANGTKNYFYEDASFWRLRNLSVGVDLPQLLKIKKVQRLQLVLSGRNLVTFTPYTGMDPEVSSGTSNSAFDRGLDHNTIPNTKTYTIGLNIGF